MPTRNTPGDCAAILQCSLLGSPQFAWQGASPAITRRQVRALLYVLASDLRPAPRDRLAFLLWPDEADATARRNLIRVLSYARQLLPRPDLLLSDNTAVALNPTLVASDAVRIIGLCAGNHAADWEMAISLYRGRFLDGFNLADSPEFDAWLGQAQRRFERAYLELLRKLLTAKSAAGDTAAAIGYARCYLAVDELAEEIHRQLITLYARQHDRRAALHQFEQCAIVLERELGVHPLPETRAVYEAMRNGASVAAPPSTPVWTTLPGLSLPLIGREQEWALLATACRQRRRGGVILIDGEAGVGKSRLMQEVATAQGVLTLSGANHAAGQSLPYQPLSQALRQALALHERWRRIAPIWLAELTRLLPEITTRFTGLPPVVATAPQQAQTRLLEALTQAFFGLTGDSPLLLCLDDVHWADEATLGWLAYVSNRLSGSGLCILATYRSVDAERLADWQAGLSRAGVVTRVPVAGLSEAAVLKLLRRAGGQSGGQALATRIHAATGGNAFFVLETIRELLAMENRPDSHADLPLPQTVRDAVLRRVGRLTPLAQQLLAMAAVLSPHLHFATLLESAGRSELETVDGIEELLAHQLLRTDGDGFRFQHELARQAVYEEISPWRRRLLHRRAGESLAHLPTVDQVELLAAIAHHFAAAGDAQQAIVYFQRAAARSQELLVQQEATAFLDKAIALAQAHEAAVGALPELYTALGDTLISAGDFARAETAYRNALSWVGRDDLLRWASLQHKVAETLPPQQRSAEAVTLQRDALARLAGEDSQPSAESGNVPGTPQANTLDRFVVRRAGDVVCGNTRMSRNVFIGGIMFHIVSVRKSRLLHIAVLGTLLLLFCSFALPANAALPQHLRLPFTYFPVLTDEGFDSLSSNSLQTPPPPGLYAAFLTQGGHIRTIFSDNGDAFKTGKFDVIHGESSDFGPAIARDPRSGVLALAFFPNDVVGDKTKLVIKLALGPTEWEEDATAWMETQTQSPPAIHYLNDGIYALAWNNGGRIATASFNYQEGLVPSEFQSTAALGAPAITSDGDTALMIWQSARQPDVYHSATGSLDGDGSVTWEHGSNIAREMPLDSGSTLTLKGRPSITWDGADYWLAATGTIDGGEASGRTIAFLKSRNGQEDWEVESTCLLDVPESNIPFEWLALAIVDNEVRVLVHRANSPPSWLKLMDDSCEVISQLQNSLLTRMQPSMIWSSILDPVEEPPANALWREQGPGPILSGGIEGIKNRPVAGAVNSIALHPFDSEIAYVGTVSGGVWRTENAEDGSPTWIPLTDKMPSLSIGSITFDPCDEQGDSLFVGTGVFSSGRSGTPAVGIYNTTDEGQTWQVLGDTDADGDTDIFPAAPVTSPLLPTDDFAGLNIRNLVASECTNTGHPILIVGTQRGIYRGVFQANIAQWQFLQVSQIAPGDCGPNPAAIRTGNISSLIRDTKEPATLYAAVPGAPVRIYMSTNAGSCWTTLSSLPAPGNHGGAIRLAMSATPSESGIPPLYAAVAIGGVSDDVFVFRSVNRGTSWAPMFSPTVGGVGPSPGGQAVRAGHFTLAADPGDANIVYVGGDRQPQPYAASGTTDFSGNLFIGDWRRRSGTWQPLVGSFANGTAPHADSRYMTFDANGHLIEADDGGVYRLRNPMQQNSRRWESMNGNLRITEFYSVAWDSHNDVIFGGTQDNGSVEQLASHSMQWRDARLFSLVGQDFRTAEGDGGSVAVDNQSNPNASVRWTMLNNYFLFYRREYPDPSPATNPGWIFFNAPENPDCPDSTLLTAPLFCGLDTSDRPADLSPTNILSFSVNLGFRIYPIAVNQVAPGRVIFASSSVYESDNQGFTWRVAMRLPARAQALAYGGIEANGTPNPEALIAAYGASLRTRQQNGVVTDRVVGTDTIVDIALDPTNWRTVYFLQANRVFRINDITNPGSARVNLTGDLADTLRSFRTLEVFHAAGETVLIVGGQPINRTIMGTDSGGVARLRNADTLVPGVIAVDWVILGSGLPNVVATDIHYDTRDDTLIAGTWGRGVWTIEHASSALR